MLFNDFYDLLEWSNRKSCVFGVGTVRAGILYIIQQIRPFWIDGTCTFGIIDLSSKITIILRHQTQLFHAVEDKTLDSSNIFGGIVGV